MKLLATADEINEELIRLLTNSASCRIAVAWASIGFGFVDRLREHETKIERMVVGTHFYQTHPAFIDAFFAHESVRFIKATDDLFHPKVYFFQMTDDAWECVVGSPNLTHGGLKANDEIAVLVTSDDEGTDYTLAGLNAAFNAYWKKASIFTVNELEAYRLAWKRKQPVLKRLKGKFGNPENDDSDDTGKPPLDVPMLAMTWEQYFSQVKSEKDHHTLDGRLAVIQGTRQLFDGHTHFREIDVIGRRKIAGLIDDSDDGVNYLWFGSMKGSGKFWKAINDNDQHLSSALDLIPPDGTVSRESYLAYIAEYQRAFPEGRHGIATATRLLAMKRPDWFVCLDARNASGLCKAFGIRQNVGYEEYWDSVIERIVESTWWNMPRPEPEQDRSVWLARAAFLDSLYYDGKGL